MIRVPCPADQLERIAYHSGRPVELQGDTAHLRIGDIEYVAELPPANA